MSETEIIREAIDYYGIDNQLMVAVEELAELQKEISKAYRGVCNEQNMIEEIADVLIMIDQIKDYYQLSDESIEAEKQVKLLRLMDRMVP